MNPDYQRGYDDAMSERQSDKDMIKELDKLADYYADKEAGLIIKSVNQKDLITDMMEWMDEVSESSLLVSSDDRRFELIQRAKEAVKDR